MDSATLDLLRSTARGVFRGSPSIADIAQLGWLGLLTPTEQGGTGWNVIEACIIAEEAGRALSPVHWSGPAIACAALAASPATVPLSSAVMAGEEPASFATADLTFEGVSAHVSGSWVRGAPENATGTIVVASEGTGQLMAFPGGSGRTVTTDPAGLDTTRSTVRIALDGTPLPLNADQLPWLVGVAQVLSCADTLGALGGA